MGAITNSRAGLRCEGTESLLDADVKLATFDLGRYVRAKQAE